MKTIIKGKNNEWEVVIGLEVHAQISTKAKLFSPGGCTFGEGPNSSVNLFDAAMPGALPVLNFSCVEKAVRTGLAVGGEINLHSVFERKHYFYPDLPSGYQITQQQKPIITGGEIIIKAEEAEGGEGKKRIRIHHIHMEQDAGKSIHDLSPDKTFIDLNRAGVPLMEIVSEPDMCSAAEAVEYVSKLKLILQYINSSEANMEKGELRCDANVSVKPVGRKELGTRCEIKNLNSLKSLAQAIEYEAYRQIELLENGGKVLQQTRLFDIILSETRAMRTKEEATDYRYFPDPDLLPLEISAEYVANINASLPELPDIKKMRYMEKLGLTEYDSDVMIQDIIVSKFFDALVLRGHNAKLAMRWLTIELFGFLNKRSLKFDSIIVSLEDFSELLKFIEEEVISERAAKDVLAGMVEAAKEEGKKRKTAKIIIDELDLFQITDEKEIEKYVLEILNNNEPSLTQYFAGKDKLHGFFVGQIMKLTKGKASPNILNKILNRELDKRRKYFA